MLSRVRLRAKGQKSLDLGPIDARSTLQWHLSVPAFDLQAQVGDEELEPNQCGGQVRQVRSDDEEQARLALKMDERQ